MTKLNCDNPERHCDFHACELKAKPRSPDIEKIFSNPRYVCKPKEL